MKTAGTEGKPAAPPSPLPEAPAPAEDQLVLWSLPTIKRGHLLKRRDMLRWSWRERYFELMEDGSLIWWTDSSKVG